MNKNISSSPWKIDTCGGSDGENLPVMQETTV